MHVALITPYLPEPQNTGGRIRIHRLARALASSGSVHLFSALADEDSAAEAARCGQGLEPYGRVVTWPLERAGVGLWNDEPAACRRFPEVLVEAIVASHDARRYDAVVIAHSRAGLVSSRLERTTIIVDEPELESSVLERRLGAQVGGGLAGHLELRRWRLFEKRLWVRADVVTTASEDAAQAIRELRPDTGIHIPNGVDVESFAYKPPSRRTGNAILFVGHMASHSNEAAARLLAREILPRVREQVSDVSLTIAGRSPSKAVRALETDDVRVTGTVSALGPLYDRHAAFIVPPVAERTMNLKVLEPLACGLPLVAPASAVRGIAIQDGTHYLAADDVAQAATALVRALGRRAELDAMALEARRTAEQLDWEVVGRKFNRLVMAAVVRRRS